VYLALRVCWLVFLVHAWIAWRAGATIVKQASGPALGRLTRLNWTARLTLALPAVLFLLLTVGVWAALWPNIPAAVVESPHEPLWVTRLLLTDVGATHDLQSLVSELITQALGPGFGLLAAMVLVALLIALYAVAPSALSEIRAPQEPRDGTRSGRWLDAGFRAARWSGRLVVAGVLIVLPAGFVAGLVLQLLGRTWPPIVTTTNARILIGAAGVLGFGGAGLVMFGSRLKRITLGLRSVLDVLLDVDNYLREHPRTHTPRARIVTRMASLLRYVYAQGYDRIVIIAHSQGTVITADLLRFIHRRDLASLDPALAARGATPIDLFTMGSPLRQLYGLRFPHLYQWARHDVPGPWTEPTEHIAATTGPDPSELGIRQWVNAYRSGDYVGRHLWRPDACEFAFAATPMSTRHPWRAGSNVVIASEVEAPPGNRREFCLGRGAHTHYWDETAPQVALELDRLVTKA
jgi:hypothetical protein